MSNQKNDWTMAYAEEKNKNGITFPSEYVIRMFKGQYPKCNLKIYGGGVYREAYIGCQLWRRWKRFDYIGSSRFFRDCSYGNF